MFSSFSVLVLVLVENLDTATSTTTEPHYVYVYYIRSYTVAVPRNPRYLPTLIFLVTEVGLSVFLCAICVVGS